MMETPTYAIDRAANTDHLKPPLFSVRGASEGPRLVVTAPDDLARALADRFWDLPSLGRMRGSLVLRAEDQDPVFDLPDIILRLKGAEVTDAYIDVLGRMAELGMISGRGVPLSRVA